MPYQHVKVPADGAKITIRDGKLQVPTSPIIPFIEGDGTGPDIWRASVRVFDAAVAKAYGGKRKIAWMEVFAGEKAFKQFDNWLPDETVEAFREFLVGIKGPLTTPIGGGIRSLNVALRQMLDLYVCLRPVRWFKGVPSPVKHPEKVDMVIFRENTEDIYAGIEFESGHRRRRRRSSRSSKENSRRIREDPLPRDDRRSASSRSRRRAPSGSSAPRSSTRSRNKRKSVTLVHKGNIMKFTEGAFRNWGYALAEREFGDQVYTWEQWERTKKAKGEDAANAEQKAALAAGQAPDQGRHRRHHAPAGADPARRVRRHRHAEPERRLPLRRPRRAGRRHRHRPRRQHQLRHRPRHLRGHPRHRAEVREPRQGEPRLGHPLRRDDAPLPGLDRSRRPHHQGHGRRDRRQDRHLRLRPPDGRARRRSSAASSATPSSRTCEVYPRRAGRVGRRGNRGSVVRLGRAPGEGRPSSGLSWDEASGSGPDSLGTRRTRRSEGCATSPAPRTGRRGCRRGSSPRSRCRTGPSR